jgi:toxin CptA
MEPLAFVLALLAIFAMGFFVQRGATCMVATVEEVITRGKWNRAGALAEAAVWSTGVLLIASALGAMMAIPQAFEAGWMSVIGGALLGFGAWLNGACVFGTIARLGNGELRMAGTLLGYPAGTFLFASLAEMRLPSLPAHAAGPAVAMALGATFATLFLVRAGLAWRSSGFAGPRRIVLTIQQPWPATVLIGMTVAAAYLLVGGAWTWMDVFNALPHGNFMNIDWRATLFAALVAGSIVGGITGGHLKLELPRLHAFIACLAGGALMAAGSLLIPGYNDGLILFGASFLLPHAILALAAMAGAIGTAIWLEARISRTR